jgi:hypothetical protein
MTISETPPLADERLAVLRTVLAARGFQVELTPDGLTVVAPVDHGPRLGDAITCRGRDSDGGKLWFWTSWNKPIIEASHVIDAAVIVGSYLRPSA